MPATATRIEARAAWRSRSNGNSSPIRSISSTSPIWAMADRTPVVLGGSSAWIAAGYSRPSTDGPRITPARISPTTGGWPTLPNSQPKIRAAATMIARSAHSSSRLFSSSR